MNDPLLWRPFDEQNINSPFEMYERLRKDDPVHVAQTKEIIITKYEDVKTILKDNRFQTGNTLEWFKRGITYLEHKGEDLHDIYNAINSFILLLNPPEHTQIRNFVAKAWNDRDVDEIIQRNVAKTFSRVGLEFDAVNDFADPLTVLNICDVLGVDGEEQLYLRDLGLSLLRSLELYPSMRELVEMNNSSKEFIDFFKDHLFIKSKTPDDGLFSKMIVRNKTENIGLTENQLISIAIFLFVAGQGTTSSLIGNGIHTLLSYPAELQKFLKNGELVNPAVEEIIRFVSPVQMVGRIAAESVQLRDKTLMPGTSVILVIGSANRDEEIFQESSTFQIERKPNRHLGFGSGIHFCLGDWLARKQAQIALGAFFNEFPRVCFTSEKFAWKKTLGVRALESLPLRLEH
jgi:pimeloyl-[acyl-carrier protein] synthase